MATIQGIYIALFGRPADPLGLDYFNGVTDGGADLSEIGDLSTQPEYLSRFEGMNNVQIVTSIYQELFGRNPDAAGLAFFTAQLNSGAQNINTIAINILDGAQGDDAALVAAKIAAADQFTAAVRADPDALAAYQGQNGIDFGQAFINQIDSSDDVLTAEQVAAQVTAFGDGEQSIPGLPGTPGSILTLTAGADVISPTVQNEALRSTSNDDTIRAIDADSLGTDDVINGGAGFDTLNISNGAVAGPLFVEGNSTPVISNVERINNSDAGATLNLSTTTGLQQVWSAGAAGTYFYTNVNAATIVGASGTGAKTVNVDFAGDFSGDSDSVSLAVDDVTGAGVTFISADDGDIEAVNLVALGDTGATATADTVNLLNFVALETLTVTGAGDINITNTADTLVSFNASAATGDVSVILNAGADELASVLTGSGSDEVEVTLGETNLIVNTGAGADSVTLFAANPAAAAGASSATITLGAGNDTFTLGAEGNLAADANTADEIEASLITITDFVRGEDTLDLTVGFGAAFDSNAGVDGVNATIAGAETLSDAIAAIRASAIDDAQFVFDGNLYLFHDGATDTLIELTGVTTLLTGADVTLA